MFVHQIVSLQDLSEAVENQLVNVQDHPYLPLSIYNYTDTAVYTRTWNDATLASRGLIVERGTGRVVARGMAKFFNYGEPTAKEYSLDTRVVVTRKEDGSLGIVWSYDGQVGVATRGSFMSDQAKHATDLINTDAYKWLRDESHKPGTPVVEIIYPANRIVLSYGEEDSLRVLGTVGDDGLITNRPLTVQMGIGGQS